MTAIIFDLDGTLIHSTPDMTVAMNRMLSEERAQPLDEATLQDFVGDGLFKLVERVIAHVGLDPARLDEIAPRVLAHYNAVNGKHTILYPGVANCLAVLHQAGHRLGICTNKPTAPMEAVLADFNRSRVSGCRTRLPRTSSTTSRATYTGGQRPK